MGGYWWWWFYGLGVSVGVVVGGSSGVLVIVSVGVVEIGDAT